MLKVNKQKISNKKIKGKAGFDANESRFGGDEFELRKTKVLSIPSLKPGVAVKMEQGWNKVSKNKDIVRISIKDIRRHVDVSVIITREELEQLVSYMAQGDELIKYLGPKISYGEGNEKANPNLPNVRMGRGPYNKPIQ